MRIQSIMLAVAVCGFTSVGFGQEDAKSNANAELEAKISALQTELVELKQLLANVAENRQAGSRNQPAPGIAPLPIPRKESLDVPPPIPAPEPVWTRGTHNRPAIVERSTIVERPVYVEVPTYRPVHHYYYRPANYYCPDAFGYGGLNLSIGGVNLGIFGW